MKGSKENISENAKTEDKQQLEKKSKKKYGVEDFLILKMIGKGGVGKVYLVRLKNTNKFYAMKVLNRQEMIEKNKIGRVLTERQILATSDHPFIVALHWCFQSNDHIYFVMDYCSGGEFFSILKKMPQKCLPEKHVRFYCAEVLIALEYLHIMGFIYRDLKPENILMASEGHVRLTDFDLAKQTNAPVKPKVIKSLFAEDIIDTKPELVSNSFVGTPQYIAPEVIEGFGHTSAVDWWTFGVLMFEMLFGKAPYTGDSREEIFQNILNNKMAFPETIPISSECKNLIKRLLCVDQNKRIGSEHGASDIKAHPWFKKITWALVRDMKPPIVPESQDLMALYGGVNEENYKRYLKENSLNKVIPKEKPKEKVDN